MVDLPHCFDATPVTEAPSLAAAAANDEEDGDADQRSYQKDREDHQEEHIAIRLLLRLKWDLLRLKHKKVRRC